MSATAGWAWLATKVVVTAALLSWVASQLDPAVLATALQGPHAGYLALAAGLALAALALGALRWQLLLSGLRIDVPLREVCAVTFIGFFLGTLLPVRLGGDAARAYYVSARSGRVLDVSLSVLLDRWIGLLGLLCVPLPLLWGYTPASRYAPALRTLYLLTAAGLALLTVLGLALARWGRPGSEGGRLARARGALSRAVAAYGSRKRLLVGALAVAIGSHLLNIGGYYVLGIPFGQAGRILDFLFLVPLVMLATLVPVSLGGAGVREWTFVRLFSDLGLARDTAVAISVLVLVVKLGTALPGAGLYFLRRRSRRD